MEYVRGMRRITRRDVLDLDADRYWRDVFFSRSFQERVYLEALGCERVEFLEERGDLATGLARRLRFVQRMDAPAPVRKLFGETTSMEEDGRFDPATKRWNFRMIPDRMADKLEITGETWLEERGPGRVERISDLNVNVKIFAVGGLVEQFIASSTETQNQKQSVFLKRFISELK